MSEYEYVQSLLETIEMLAKIVKTQNEVLKQNGIELYVSRLKCK